MSLCIDLERGMSDLKTLEDDRKRADAFEALALPVRDSENLESESGPSPSLEIHDGEIFAADSADEDILEGLDVPERGDADAS